MVLNNIAQKKYLASEIKYNYILDFIMSKLKKIKFKSNFKSFNDIINFINLIKYKHDNKT